MYILYYPLLFYDMCEVFTSQSAAAATSSPSASSTAGNTVPVTTLGPIHGVGVGLLSLWDDVMHVLTRWHQFPRLPYRSVAICALTRTDNVAHLSGWSSFFPQAKSSCDMEVPRDHPPRPTRGFAAARKANNSTSSCRSRVMPPASSLVGSPLHAASSGWTTGLCCDGGIICTTADVYGSKP